MQWGSSVLDSVASVAQTADDAPVNFERPPVAEVAMAVQFAAEVAAEGFALNQFWPRIRDRYPKLSAQPALPPMREDFGPNPGVAFQLLGGPVLPSRYWFVSQDDAEVVQVQGDRLAFNWRREPAPGIVVGDYPRYEYVRARFAAVLAEFLDEIAHAKTPAIPNWCEIAYINQIPATDSNGDLPLASILRLIENPSLEKLPPPEDTSFAQRHVLTRAEKPFGRFHLTAARGLRINQAIPFPEPVYVINLTVRGLVDGPSAEDIMTFMDYGRDLIVHTFRDVTTDKMHDYWGLQ